MFKSLMSEVARHFFNFGFRRVARNEVTPVLHQFIEWLTTSLVTAHVMAIRISPSQQWSIKKTAKVVPLYMLTVE